jgi:hypothetical protein
MLIQLPVSSSHAILRISTALCPLHSEVTALEESCHPERSVLGEVKDLYLASGESSVARDAPLERRDFTDFGVNQLSNHDVVTS